MHYNHYKQLFISSPIHVYSGVFKPKNKEEWRMEGYRCYNCQRYYYGSEWVRECPYCGSQGFAQNITLYRCLGCRKTYYGGEWKRECPFCGTMGEQISDRMFQCNRCSRIYPSDQWGSECPYCGSPGMEL